MRETGSVLQMTPAASVTMAFDRYTLAMNTEHDNPTPQETDSASSIQQQQQPQQAVEGHAGQGSESAMKQMRVWEQRRASNSTGRGRQGPN